MCTELNCRDWLHHCIGIVHDLDKECVILSYIRYIIHTFINNFHCCDTLVDH